MGIKPILFNTEMIQAILEGRKTQTRRLLKPKFRPDEAGFQIITNTNTGEFVRVEYYDEHGRETRWMPQPFVAGDILWVRETWCKDAGRYMYRANYADDEKFYRDGKEVRLRWSPSIHMPKNAARIFLWVTGVRLERLLDITENDAMCEGCYAGHKRPTTLWSIPGFHDVTITAKDHFFDVWESTIKPDDWDVYGINGNPWVWVIEFERVERPASW